MNTHVNVFKTINEVKLKLEITNTFKKQKLFKSLIII